MNPIEIEFCPADSPGTYWPVHDGRKLTKATRQPFFDGARALLKSGAPGNAEYLARHAGSDVIAMRSTVGEAARWSVSEPDRGVCKRIPYVPYTPGVTVHAAPPGLHEALTPAERSFVGRPINPEVHGDGA